MADETRGHPDFDEHRLMWDRFTGLVKWTLISTVVILILMAMFLV